MATDYWLLVALLFFPLWQRELQQVMCKRHYVYIMLRFINDFHLHWFHAHKIPLPSGFSTLLDKTETTWEVTNLILENAKAFVYGIQQLIKKKPEVQLCTIGR